MERDELVLDIKGPEGSIDAHAVVDGLQHLLKLLESLPVTRGDNEPWTVSRLDVGSAIVGVAGRAERVGIVTEGLSVLQRRATIPHGWSPASVHELIELGKIRHRSGVTDVILRNAEQVIALIDDTLIDHASKSIEPPPPSLGSVRGHLFRYNDDTKTAGLRDTFTGSTVPVTFPNRLAAGLRQALTKEVIIWGDVHRTKDGTVDRVRAEGFDVTDPPKSRPVDDIVGILADDWPSGINSVDWVRGQRDE